MKHFAAVSFWKGSNQQGDAHSHDTELASMPGRQKGKPASHLWLRYWEHGSLRSLLHAAAGSRAEDHVRPQMYYSRQSVWEAAIDVLCIAETLTTACLRCRPMLCGSAIVHYSMRWSPQLRQDWQDCW